MLLLSQAFRGRRASPLKTIRCTITRGDPRVWSVSNRSGRSQGVRSGTRLVWVERSRFPRRQSGRVGWRRAGRFGHRRKTTSIANEDPGTELVEGHRFRWFLKIYLIQIFFSDRAMYRRATGTTSANVRRKSQTYDTVWTGVWKESTFFRSKENPRTWPLSLCSLTVSYWCYWEDVNWYRTEAVMTVKVQNMDDILVHWNLPQYGPMTVYVHKHGCRTWSPVIHRQLNFLVKCLVTCVYIYPGI